MKRYSLKLNKILPLIIIPLGFYLFISFTNPNSVLLPLLIIPFVLIGIFIFSIVYGVLNVSLKHKDRFSTQLLSLSIATLAVLMLLLQSLNQLTWRDGLLTTIFAAMFWVYIWRADFLRK